VTELASNRKENSANARLNAPSPSRQVRFYQLLVAARKQWFMDALAEVLGRLDQGDIKKQVGQFVPSDVQRILAAAGIRDEYVFPVPALIEAKPSLIGYYRLLLGSPQKSFYHGSTGMAQFKSMEEKGALSDRQKIRVPDFCAAMAEPLAQLVRQIPGLNERDLRELPLLAFGSQLQGSNNTQIGKKAMQDIFAVIDEIVQKYTTAKDANRLTVRNSARRTILITMSHDPDVRIEEVVGEGLHHRIAIEVKGGTDASNAHNRAGEAEKSHLKAKAAGFPEFWTIISKRGLDVAKLRAESQTTNHWFDIAEVLARKGSDWKAFRERLAAAVGIPYDPDET
jgi:hypothetical protein